MGVRRQPRASEQDRSCLPFGHLQVPRIFRHHGPGYKYCLGGYAGLAAARRASLALYACARECGGGLGNPQDTATRGTKGGPIIATPCRAGHDGPDIDLREFTKLCLAENDRRPGIYARLLALW